MLELKPITLEDSVWIKKILTECDYMSCEYSFGNHFIWKPIYNILVANVNEFYIAALNQEDGLSFLYPAGKGDITPVIEQMIDYCQLNSIPFKMHSLTNECKDELNRCFPDKFDIVFDRDYCDYIYLREDLATLSGKKYHGKRNHIKRFKENNWSFEPINENNIDECIEMNKQWCMVNDCKQDPSKQQEACAVKRCFKYFNELNFFGGLIRIDSKVVAYTIAERLNSNTVVVHMEKAFSDIQGAYPAINQEFIINMASEFEYVNREEDLGLEGLRKAKLSYRPAILLEKHSAIYK